MKLIRQLHLYFSTFCAPLILYFCLSGAWQLFGVHDIPKGEAGTVSQRLLHALSMPHTHSTPPGGDPEKNHSSLFDVVACATALAMIASALLGLALAWRFAKRPILVYALFAAGVLVPVLFLFV